MKTIQFSMITLAWLLVVCCSSEISGAEIQLKSSATVSGTVVRLGEVAQIYSSNPAEKNRLSQVELCLAPSTTSLKTLHIREVKRTLNLRGVLIGKHRFAGSASVKITRQDSKVNNVQFQQVSNVKVRSANSRIVNSIKRYLNQHAANLGTVKIHVNLSKRDVTTILTLGSRYTITGGKSPWTGIQQFQIIATSRRGQINIPVKAEVVQESGVVMTVCSLERGAILQASDVAIIQPTKNRRYPKAFHSIEDIVGKELTRSVSENQPLSGNYVRARILVKRGEGVTVYSNAAGVSVKTVGRARESGSKGQLIEIESTINRKRFFAKVFAPQIVVIDNQ